MEELAEIRISRLPMEVQPDLLWAPMEQLELSWAPEEQKDQGLHGLLADQQLRLASAAASIGLQMKDYLAHDDDVTLQLLEEPRDEGNLDKWLSDTICGYYHQNQGDLHSSPSQRTNVNHQMEVMRSEPEGTRNFPSKKRGPRKKRMSPWNPSFFERKRRRSASVSRLCTHRKNNSHWTPEEVESLVKGISKYGIGKWTEVKGKYFRWSVRTSVNLKDKWRNLLKAYDTQLTSKKNKRKVQKTVLLHLEQSLIKRIRELAEKHRRGSEATLADSSSNVSTDSFLIF